MRNLSLAAAALILLGGAAYAEDRADVMIGIQLQAVSKDGRPVGFPLIAPPPDASVPPGRPDLSIKIDRPKRPQPASSTAIYLGGRGGCLIMYNNVCVINGTKMEVWK